LQRNARALARGRSLLSIIVDRGRDGFAWGELFAVRTYTGSPHCAEAQSNQGGTDHAVTVSDWSSLAPRAELLAPPCMTKGKGTGLPLGMTAVSR